MKKNGKTIAAVLGFALSAALPLAAYAQSSTPGIYVGIAGGQAEPIAYDTCETHPSCKKKGSAYRFFAGWQFTRIFGVEFAYTDFGKASSSGPGFDQSIKVRVGDANVVAQWPASERLALFGKAGAYYAATSVDTADTTPGGVSGRRDESRGGITFGAGIQWYVWQSLALRGEGQHYMKVGGSTIGDSDYNVYTLGLLYKF